MHPAMTIHSFPSKAKTCCFLGIFIPKNMIQLDFSINYNVKQTYAMYIKNQNECNKLFKEIFFNLFHILLLKNLIC